MSESQTPRTDAIAFWYRPYSEHAADEEWCQADFARQLESELTATRARLAEIEAVLSSYHMKGNPAELVKAIIGGNIKTTSRLADYESQGAAATTAREVKKYLNECSSNERWPDEEKVDNIFAQNFAPIMHHKLSRMESRLGELEGITERLYQAAKSGHVTSAVALDLVDGLIAYEAYKEGKK